VHAETKRILILCKTYPSPSARHVETSCVAGMEESGQLVRLYPVPFRMIQEEQRFRKWQWIRARVRESPEDHRPESHRNYNAGSDGVLTIGSIEQGRRRCLAARLRCQDTRNDGKDVLSPLYEPVVVSFAFCTLTLRGFESQEGAAYAQEWRCTLGSTRT
jgi:hypothetical protein